MARTEVDIWVSDFFNVDLTTYSPAPAKAGHGHHKPHHKPHHEAHPKAEVTEALDVEIDVAFEPAPEHKPHHKGHGHHKAPKAEVTETLDVEIDVEFQPDPPPEEHHKHHGHHHHGHKEKPKHEVKPDVPEEPDPPFEPPAKPGQPTLRKGDKNSDGWVEYAQQLLNFQLKGNLKVDGDFGGGTLAAVHKFQKAKKLQDDGTIGNQTWAALREGAPEKVGTDERKAHTFEQKDKQGRFTTETSHMCLFLPDQNKLTMRIVSTGEQSIEGGKVTVRVTQPDGTAKTQAGAIGKVDGPTPDGQGQLHSVEFQKFTDRFKIADPATVPACVVDAYLEKEIGGDVFQGHPQVG